jgi:uncharacterized protein (TIGR03790 family)
VILRLFVFFSAAAWVWVARAEDAPRVLVLANSDDPESMAVARHYVERRALPESAIVALPMPLTEQITWREFVVTIWNPLLKEAISRGDVDAIAMSLADELGRVKIAPNGHGLDALVICRGVPLRVAHDPAVYNERSNPLAMNPLLRTTEASVDSELSLLAMGQPPIAAIVPNPLYTAEVARSAEALRQIIPVGRLDGPSLEDAKALVDRALEAEKNGIAGRAYVDIGGPHRQGDDWLQACVPELTALGFETDVDLGGGTLAASARFDAPILYFGWYAGDLNGPFREAGFRFPTGAIALHIHSFSATTLRSTTRGWAGPLVAKGVTATFGNVGEPYLQFTHQPQLLLRALARGESLGVAALRSINALSWKAVLVGDPLYRPFAVSAEEQWARRKELNLGAEAATFVRIRRMRLLAAAGRGGDALALGVAGMRQEPSLALALTLAGMQLSAGDAMAARRTLELFGLLPKWRAEDRPLVTAAAWTLQAAQAADEGVKLLERLLADAGLSTETRVALLKQGVELARAAQDFTRAGKWDAEHALLTAPPPSTTPVPATTAGP